MTNTTEALLSIARPASPEHLALAPSVVAIVRLSESRRSWFVTAVWQKRDRVEVVGYSPGCSHAAGRWFNLAPDFFEKAAAASGDRVEVDVLRVPVLLEQLEDEFL